MSRRRYLSSDAGRDKGLRDVARVSLFAHSLYLLAIPCAADDCSLPTNDPDELLWEIWPAMARDYGAEDVQAAINLLIAHHLWEYGPDGRLRYPPRSFYKHQTYIRGQRRGGAQVQEERAIDSAGATESAEPRTAAQPTSNGETVAQNGAKQRTSAQNSASLESSFSSSSSFSSPPLPPPTTATPLVEGWAPDADAPDAEPGPEPSEAPLAVIEPVPKPTGHPFGELWDAFDAVFGEARTRTEQSRRGRACKEARESHVSGDELLLAAQHWSNVMGDATMTELGIVANLGKLLHGPQVNGRSNGTVTAHTQRLTETALVPHQATVADIRRRRKANDEPGR
jgi:hypothetical protein